MKSKRVNIFSMAGLLVAGIASIVAMSQGLPILANQGRINDPFVGRALYIDPDSEALQQQRIWQLTQPSDAAQMAKIAKQPQAKWFGDWDSNIYQDAKSYLIKVANAKAYAVLVAYDVPFRDCGSYSAGGASNSIAYQKWISQLSDAIGAQSVAVVVEPDALAGMDCLTQSQKAQRILNIRFAVDSLSSKPNIAVYIDAGNSNWLTVGEAANRLRQVDISKATGFSLDVSYFTTASQNTSYGVEVSKLVGGKHFVINTSRSGQGASPNGQWCNPQGRGLGEQPSANTGNPLVDAYLWIKLPGESDGLCNGGPQAGQWWPQYALELAKNSKI